MTVKEIVKAWLADNGNGGLCRGNYGDDPCGCKLDDLMPCGEPAPDCVAGYRVPVPEGSDAGFWISEERPGTTCGTVGGGGIMERLGFVEKDEPCERPEAGSAQ